MSNCGMQIITVIVGYKERENVHKYCQEYDNILNIFI